VVWKKFWKDNYFFEDELLQLFLQLRMLSRVRAVCCAGLLYVMSASSHSWPKGNLQEYYTTTTAVRGSTNVKCYTTAVVFVPSTAKELLDK